MHITKNNYYNSRSVFKYERSFNLSETQIIQLYMMFILKFEPQLKINLQTISNQLQIKRVVIKYNFMKHKGMK